MTFGRASKCLFIQGREPSSAHSRKAIMDGVNRGRKHAPPRRARLARPVNSVDCNAVDAPQMPIKRKEKYNCFKTVSTHEGMSHEKVMARTFCVVVNACGRDGRRQRGNEAGS